jgi:HD-like signal output (HDOD) protein
MGKVSIDALKPGMVLAEDITHTNGRFLLGKGVKLEENHLRMLKMWGIHSASVEGISGEPTPPPLEQIDPHILKDAEKRVRRRFVHCQTEHPFMQELIRICTLRQAQQMVMQKSSLDPSDLEALEALVAPKRQPSTPSPSSKVKPEDIIDSDIGLASLPNIFWEITKVTSDPRSSAVHVAEVISKDTSLSAKLLKMVNSAFYGFPAKIDTISRAVMIVGSKQLSTLALGTSVIQIFRSIPAELVDMKGFWQHSICCGISARMISSFKNAPNTERFFVAGLLHDIGRIILYKKLPRLGKEILLLARQSHNLLRTVENQMLGFDHAILGGVLMKKWRLPLILEHTVGYHHQPLRCQYPSEAAIINLADLLTNALGIGSSGERYIPPLSPEVWDALGLPVEIFHKTVQTIDHQVAEIMHTFFDEN